MTWKLVYTKQAKKMQRGLRKKAEAILDILKKNPFQKNPSFEKLVGDLEGAYSRRINIKHRLVYQVLKRNKTIKVLRMWAHYE